MITTWKQTSACSFQRPSSLLKTIIFFRVFPKIKLFLHNRYVCTIAHMHTHTQTCTPTFHVYNKVRITCRVESDHPVSGGAVPDVEVAEDEHGTHEQVEEPPVAGAVHDVALLSHEPEGHHQPVGTWREQPRELGPREGAGLGEEGGVGQIGRAHV